MPVNADAVKDGDVVFIYERHKSHFESCIPAPES
jgi:hypothetical protein